MKATLFVAAALCLSAGAAFAHAELISETPAAGVAVTTPKVLVLHFSEKVAPSFSGAKVTGPQGQAAKLGRAKSADGGRTLDIPVARDLGAGLYHVAWHALSADGHHSQGSYEFTVK